MKKGFSGKQLGIVGSCPGGHAGFYVFCILSLPTASQYVVEAFFIGPAALREARGSSAYSQGPHGGGIENH